MLFIVEEENAARDRMIAEWSRQDRAAREVTKELREVDRLLEVVYVDPAAGKLSPEDRAPGVVPGRWHVVRRNGGAVPDAWFPIMGPEGEFVEPSPRIVEDMKRADLWRPGALQELRHRLDAEDRRRARAELTASEQRQDEMATAYRAAKRVSGDGGIHRTYRRHGTPERSAKK